MRKTCLWIWTVFNPYTSSRMAAEVYKWTCLSVAEAANNVRSIDLPMLTSRLDRFSLEADALPQMRHVTLQGQVKP